MRLINDGDTQAAYHGEENRSTLYTSQFTIGNYSQTSISRNEIDNKMLIVMFYVERNNL